MTTANSRKADHPIDAIFLQRWSPRAFTEAEISETDLLTIFEAARWAPSSYNSQPWRLLYARRGDAHWSKFLALLNDFNRSWAARAAALVIFVSRENMLPLGAEKEIPSYSHSFDAGAAWAALGLQASLSGWQAHAMAGFDHDKARIDLRVPAGYRVEAAVAIGQVGDPAILPEKLAARETPSSRLPLAEIVIPGGFAAD